jgi:uncharacterized membrane protein YsdA (DUF1294 family)
LVWIGFLSVNALSFAQFGFDKRRAELGLQRIPESTLLETAALGGWIGAYLGRAHFRHKTRKQPFPSRLYQAAALNVTVMTGVGCWLMVAA